MNIRKIIITSLIVAITIAAMVGLYFYFKPVVQKIDMTTTGIQFKNNDPSGYFEEKEITIKGTYEHFLFGNKADTFWGQFSVEGYDFTFDEEYSMSTILMQHFGLMQYFKPDLKDQKILGFIHKDTYFKEFMIVVSNEEGNNTSYTNGIVISAPAKNRVEAVAIAEKLFSQSALSELWSDWNDWN